MNESEILRELVEGGYLHGMDKMLNRHKSKPEPVVVAPTAEELQIADDLMNNGYLHGMDKMLGKKPRRTRVEEPVDEVRPEPEPEPERDEPRPDPGRDVVRPY